MAISTAKLSLHVFRQLRDFIYKKSGIYFQEKKLYLLESRLNRRLRTLEIDSFENYVTYLMNVGNQQEELVHVFNEITINETYFYRYINQLNAFAKKILPDMMKKHKSNGKKKIKIWSTASSSGEELYSIGMLLKENFAMELRNWDFELIGTDISQRILDRAKEGKYSNNSFRNDVPAYIKSRYFRIDGRDNYLDDSIKNMVQFEKLNLCNTDQVRTMGNVDFVFCRNVLIYFDENMKKKVIRSLYDSLNQGGYIFLGEAESLHGISSSFKVEHFPGAFAYKKEA